MGRERSDQSHIPPARGSVACLRLAGLCIALLLLFVPVHAQTAHEAGDSLAQAAATWRLVVDGASENWSEAPPWPLDSLQAVTRRALAHVQRDGYYRARVDSVAIHERSAPPLVQIFIQRGPRIRIGRLRIRGAETLSADALRALMETHEGATLDPDRLEHDIEAVLGRYEEAGYPLAQIRVAETDLQPGDPTTLHLTIEIDEGPALWLKRVAVDGEARASSRFVAHVARLNVGAPLTDYDPEAIRERLRDTGLFRAVGTPELQVEADGGAVLHVPLEEGAPGTFDVALGYLPPASESQKAQLVGSGHLRLENLFGGGRTAGLQIDRRPGQVSEADVHLADPYVLGRPLRLEGRFTGEQRDSTYGKQAYRLSAGYLIEAETEVFGTLAREGTQPGQAGARLRSGRQQIPRTAGWFTGLGVRVRQVDRAINPRRGFWLEMTLERGQKTRRFRAVTAAGDTTRQRDDARQERLRLSGRFFVPTLARQLFALGVDASVLRSDTYDRSDLFRIGGATTLRGYDEDRFLGHAVGRLLLEYRYQIDRQSFAYLFGDLGYVATPSLDDQEATRRFHPGYGLGLQFGTEIGRVRASYALNPEDGSPANGRIHIGLSLGL